MAQIFARMRHFYLQLRSFCYLGPPDWNPEKQSSGHIFLTNLGFGAFLNAVRGRRVYKGISGRRKAHKHKLFALVNVRMVLGQTAGCPRVNRAKKFYVFASKHRKYKLFPLVNRRVVPSLSRLSRSLCVQSLCAFSDLFSRVLFSFLPPFLATPLPPLFSGPFRPFLPIERCSFL